VAIGLRRAGVRCSAVSTPTLVLLAAGMGSRFGGPKQIAPIGPGGSALIDYAARDAVAAGFERLVLIVRGEILDAVERDRKSVV
jgi:CTP:molybdopterin cytidylyltransferase MocA